MEVVADTNTLGGARNEEQASLALDVVVKEDLRG